MRRGCGSTRWRGEGEGEAVGAVIAHPLLELAGGGALASYVLGGIQYGVWED
ncbi:MAG: hypothetical protein ACI89L_002394 [Phycisphaerales bacterium]|jgi:hypothetical protein